MSLQIYLRNRNWLNSKLDQYPFRCQTGLDFPTHRQVEKKFPGMAFISASLMKSREWGFTSALAMSNFKAAYLTKDNRK